MDRAAWIRGYYHGVAGLLYSPPSGHEEPYRLGYCAGRRLI